MAATSRESSAVAMGQTVAFLVKSFLDDEHLSMLHHALSNSWNRMSSLSAAMKLMEQHGVHLTPEEAERLSLMDEMQQINALVCKMPQQSNEQFQHFFLQLQLIVSTATRVRQALEGGRADQVEAALSDAESTGIAPYILKMAIVQAGTEVSTLRHNYENWIHDCDARMSRLIRGQEDAMLAQKKLNTAQQELTMFQVGANEKVKKALMGFASGSSTVMLHAALDGWHAYVQTAKQEAIIAEEYQERMDAADDALLQFKLKQRQGVNSVLSRKAMASDTALKEEVFKLMVDNVADRKFDLENAEKIREMQEKLKAVQDSHKDNTMRVMFRMGADSDEALMRTCWQAILAFHAEWKQNQQLEEAVKEQEKRIAEWLKAKSQGAQSIMSKIGGATDTGLMTECFKGWYQQMLDEKHEAEMAAKLNDAQGRFKNIMGKNAKNAEGCLERAQDQLELMLVLQTFLAWQLDAKMEATIRVGHSKIDAKRQQLVGVQQMFRSFAVQLESSLKDGADSTRGDFALTASSKGPRKRLQKTDMTTSLPDIHGHKGFNSQQATPKVSSDSRRTPKQGSGRDVPPPRAAWG